jgi:ParB-like nuclease family protein
LNELEAREDFDAARFRAFRRAIGRVLTGRWRRLVPLDRIVESAGLESRSSGGIQEIPLDKVVGSASGARMRDFDPAFLPLSRRLRDRWARIYAAHLDGEVIPPIDVYKLGDRYYVIDGHHRVSVFRRLGHDSIRAQVTEVRTRAPIGPDVDPADLLRAAEYQRFLQATELDRVRPGARLEVSRLGRYDELLKHILGHRYFMGIEHAREVPMREAAAGWYDAVYLPIVEEIRRHRVLDQLPGWTETDLYVEITRRWLAMSEAGAEAGPHAAVHALLQETPRPWWNRLRPPVIP